MAITVHEKISESATTTVYRAYDETLRRDVLLKVLHRSLAHDDQVRQRFVREARACAALHSENIVQVFDLRDHEGSPAIVMEFVNGRSLKEVIAEGKERSYAFAEKVAVHVLSGLAVAHSQGVTHRDIKPGNILVSSDGTIKITDFGLAQIAVSPTLTTEGTVVGTPAYFSPEVVRGQPADARSDLFSLGATIVETLTGERLFDGKTYAECLNRITMFKTERIDSLTGVSSAEFVAFLKRLMDPDRERRFASPKDALAALKNTSSSQFAGHSERRKDRWLKVGIPLVTLLLAAVIYVLVRHSGDGPTGTPALSSLALERSSVQAEPPADTVSNKEVASRNLAESLRRKQRVPDGEARPAPARDFGSLALSGNRGAQVHVDEQLIGEIPLDHPIRISAGTHTVLFTLAPFQPIVRVVQVSPGQEVPIMADFLEKAGYLRCIATPWAEIFIDDLYRDTTPNDRPIVVTAGTHRVRFHHPSFRDSVCEVSVAPRETLSVNLTFKP